MIKLGFNTINESTSKYDKAGLIKFLKSFKPKASEDIDITTSDGIEFSLFWHEPSLNVSWYPIIQIDYKGKTVFNREGTENPDYWTKVVKEAIDKLNKIN